MNAVRVLTTNDFVASFFPQTTSYGRLPGAAALQATVDDLHTDLHTEAGARPALGQR